MMKSPEQVEHERIRSALAILLMASNTMLITILLFIAALVFLRHGEALREPRTFFTLWLESASTLSRYLIQQASPVSTSFSVATLVIALVLACSFNRRPEETMLGAEIIRLQFLENVTSFTSIASGCVLVVSGALIIFSGLEALAPAALTISCGFLSLSLGVMVPVSAKYWKLRVENEESNLQKLKEAYAAEIQLSGPNAWIQALTLIGLIRALWTLAFILAMKLLIGVELHLWTNTALMAIMLASGALWDASAVSLQLRIEIDRIVDRWNAVVIGAIYVLSTSLLLLSAVIMTEQINWILTMFFGFSILLPSMMRFIPHINTPWRRLRREHLVNAARNSKSNLFRYTSLLDLTSSEGQRGSTTIFDEQGTTAVMNQVALDHPAESKVRIWELRRGIKRATGSPTLAYIRWLLARFRHR